MPADSDILITVIMPVYNGEAYLGQALDSIARQSPAQLAQLEIIAVDDGSTDRSPDILQERQSQLPLKILRKQSGSNWMAATNAGLRAAAGEWISFLHQDDFWEPHRLAKLFQAIDTHAGLSFFAHPVYFVDPRGRRKGVWRSPWPAGKPLAFSQTLAGYASQNFIGIPAPVFKRELLARTSPLREDLWFLADWDFWLRLIHCADGLCWLEEPLASFRIHPASQTAVRSHNEQDLRRQFAEIRNLVRHLNNGIHPRQAASLLNEELTITLANWSHHKKGHPLKCLRRFCGLRPRDLPVFFRETRLMERVLPRLRIRKPSFPETAI